MENSNIKRLNERAYKIFDEILDLDTNFKRIYDIRFNDIQPGCTHLFSHLLSRFLVDNCIKNPHVLLSGDNRRDTPLILDELEEGFLEAGFTVINAGYNNITPMFEREREKLGICGINVTASHQSKQFNGLKIVIEDKPDEQLINEIKKKSVKISGKEVHYAQQILRERYIDEIVAYGSDLKGIETPMLIDAMQGSSFWFFKEVADRLGFNYEGFRTEPNGNFPLTTNGPDPSQYANIDYLRQAKTNASLIHLIDGDGDRYGLALNINNEIRMVESPIYSVLRAKSLLEQEPERKCFVTETVLYHIVRESLEKLGIEAKIANRGRKNLIEAVRDCRDKALGGEELSLHHYDENGFDDAIRNVLETIRISQKVSLEDEIQNISNEIKYFIPELRVDYQGDRRTLYKNLENTFPLAHESDGIFIPSKDIHSNLRCSSNENAVTLNVSSSRRSDVEDFVEYIYSKISHFDKNLSQSLKEDYERKMEDRRKYCFPGELK